MILHDISDHYPITLHMNMMKNMPPSPQNMKIKVINDKTLLKLKKNLGKKSWTSILNLNDSNGAYDLLLKEINESIQETIPEKPIPHRTRNQNPWLTKGVLKSIRQKNKLYKLLKNN